MLMLRIVALALASATAQAQLTPGMIAGYHALTDVDSYLLNDLVQQKLESLLEDSNEKATCPSFAAGKAFYYQNSPFPAGGKPYFDSIPTYGGGGGEKISAEYKEYIEWAGGGNGGKDFHKKWVNAVFNKGTVSKGNMTADFGATTFPNDPYTDGDCVGVEESVKKATSYVYNHIEALQLMQASIQSAKGGCIYQQDNSCETALNYWDASVAVYVGSLEGANGAPGGSGKSHYALANKRCRNFKNCGAERNEGNSRDQVSPINTQILAYFSAGQHAAFAGDWRLMEDFKKIISAKMAVPWIQGTLRYAHRLSAEPTRANDKEFSNTNPLDSSGIEVFDTALKTNPDSFNYEYSELDKEVGEAAAFSLGSVPKLWACDKNAAQLVWSQVSPGGGIAGVAPVNYQLVKLAFECNYKCLLTSCDEVGSLYDGQVAIKNGAKKCNDKSFGYDPAGYSKCKKPKRAFRDKCDFLTGNPGIGGRDALQYFKKTI